jgi:hypothetical protein
MDYRRTEDFARRMEAAEFRARLLREQFIDDLVAAMGRGLRNAARALAARWRAMQNARAARARAL